MRALHAGLLGLGLCACLGSAVTFTRESAAATREPNTGEPHPGHATLSEADLRAHLDVLAGPATEGRDSPSLGLELAADYISECFAAAGLVFAPDSVEAWQHVHGDEALPEPPAGMSTPGTDGEGAASGTRVIDPTTYGTYLRPFTRPGLAPVPDECRLELLGDDGRAFEYGRDFVPVGGFDGAARGELIFAGFAIDSSKEKYNDLAGLNLRGKIALVLQGEPDHKRRFSGPEISSEGSLWTKINRLEDAGAAAVLVARRPRPWIESGAAEDAGDGLAYRYTWARFNGGLHRPEPRKRLPVLELSTSCATELCGTDVAELFASYDKSVKPKRLDLDGREVDIASRTESSSLSVDNVVGWIKGADPALKNEVVVLGAHYDHLGVDSRGRVGLGADDNASGTAVLIEVAEALAANRPRRSVLVCAFASEEDGLFGSKAIAARPPVAPESMVAMINMDMIGRGNAKEVAVIGVRRNPEFERILKRAKDSSKTGMRKIVMRQGEELFQRSDHYSFHQIGVPAIFFFEGLPISRNKDYHTWRDTIDGLNFDKIENTARLVFNAVWILANDDERLPAPRNQ